VRQKPVVRHSDPEAKRHPVENEGNSDRFPTEEEQRGDCARVKND
jgi:hypothetical protein